MRFRRPRRPSATVSAGLALALVVIAGATAALSSSGCTDARANAIAGQIDITELVAYWAVRGRDSEGNNYIRPAVRFRVKNSSAEPIQYVQVMSVFRRESNLEEAWGTGYIHSVSENAIAPGEATGEQTLRSDSNYLSKGSPARMFENDLWEDVEVEIYVRVGASDFVSRGKTTALRRLGPPGVEKYLEPDEDEPIYGQPPPDPEPSADSETPSEAEPEPQP